jgi:hypothetical protein
MKITGTYFLVAFLFFMLEKLQYYLQCLSLGRILQYILFPFFVGKGMPKILWIVSSIQIEC